MRTCMLWVQYLIMYLLEYLDQVRTKRRSLDRTDLTSSPTKEVEEDQGAKKDSNIYSYEFFTSFCR